jgi:hypothetical protein
MHKINRDPKGCETIKSCVKKVNFQIINIFCSLQATMSATVSKVEEEEWKEGLSTIQLEKVI